MDSNHPSPHLLGLQVPPCMQHVLFAAFPAVWVASALLVQPGKSSGGLLAPLCWWNIWSNRCVDMVCCEAWVYAACGRWNRAKFLFFLIWMMLLYLWCNNITLADTCLQRTTMVPPKLSLMPMPRMTMRERNKNSHPGLVDLDPPSAQAKPSQECQKTAEEKAEEDTQRITCGKAARGCQEWPS